MRRGGDQQIPRPADAQPGADAPWAHLPTVDRQPSLATIERAFADRAPRVYRDDERARNESAVLVPLYEADGDAHVILTRRAAHLRLHTHQVSFPGGRVDADDPDHWHTAVREAQEEIALDPSLPRHIGSLDRFVVYSSDSFIHPEVAGLPGRPDLVASPDEVEHILHVPIAELLSDDAWREELWLFDGARRRITFFELHGDTVWGATATMLRQLLTVVTAVTDDDAPAPA